MRIGIASWVIQDGNYSDFSVGEVRSFALEFHFPELSVSDQGAATYTLYHGSVYDICARVCFQKEGLTVIDFGQYAYSEQKIAAAVGQWISGRAYVGVDPFMYFENWERASDVPRIRREWRIDRIFMETTPLVEERPQLFVRDESRFSEIEVTKTDAWNDDHGNAHYALECSEIERA